MNLSSHELTCPILKRIGFSVNSSPARKCAHAQDCVNNEKLPGVLPPSRVPTPKVPIDI